MTKGISCNEISHYSQLHITTYLLSVMSDEFNSEKGKGNKKKQNQFTEKIQ